MNTTAPGAREVRRPSRQSSSGAIAVVVFGAAGAASYLGLLPGQAAQAPASPVGMAKPAQQAGLVPDAVVPPQPAPAPAPSPCRAGGRRSRSRSRAGPGPGTAAQPAPCRQPLLRNRLPRP